VRFGFSEEQIAKLDGDIAEMEKLVAQEQAAREAAAQVYRAGLAKEINAEADKLLQVIDATGRRSIFLAPKDILGKKGN
jgi:regulator of protease activity HflC (stomatin/prohibitin superfamily)